MFKLKMPGMGAMIVIIILLLLTPVLFIFSIQAAAANLILSGIMFFFITNNTFFAKFFRIPTQDTGRVLDKIIGPYFLATIFVSIFVGFIFK